jgi:hypothetical protein
VRLTLWAILKMSVATWRDSIGPAGPVVEG